MEILPELKKLVFLTLCTHNSDDVLRWDGPDLIPHKIDSVYVQNLDRQCRKLPPLRQLRLDAEWEYAFPLLSKLSSPGCSVSLDLRELAFSLPDSVDFQKVSEMFPRLEALAVPTVSKFLTDFPAAAITPTSSI